MSNIKLFESKRIRSIWDDQAQRWLFAIVDIVAALSDSQNPQVYWRVLKKRLLAEGNETVTNCNALKMTAPDGSEHIKHILEDGELDKNSVVRFFRTIAANSKVARESILTYYLFHV